MGLGGSMSPTTEPSQPPDFSISRQHPWRSDVLGLSFPTSMTQF